jgi:glycine/D-amino acid oxidase-like deaminating enzyme
MAHYGRTRWAAIARRIPETGFDPVGSILLLRNAQEVAVAAEYVERNRDRLALEIIHGDRLSSYEPAITGNFLAGLACADDAWIKPGLAVQAMLDYLVTAEAIDLKLGAGVERLEPVTDGLIAHTNVGAVRADVAYVCSGDVMNSLFSSALEAAPVRRTRLHAFEIDVRTSPRALVTDGSALRLYPGFVELDSAAALTTSWSPTSGQVEWVVARSPDRSVLVGDLRQPEATATTTMGDTAEDWLWHRTEEALGHDVSRPRRRWAATILESRNPGLPYLDIEPVPQVHLITALGTMGNTLAPAIARNSVELLG